MPKNNDKIYKKIGDQQTTPLDIKHVAADIHQAAEMIPGMIIDSVSDTNNKTTNHKHITPPPSRQSPTQKHFTQKKQSSWGIWAGTVLFSVLILGIWIIHAQSVIHDTINQKNIIPPVLSAVKMDFQSAMNNVNGGNSQIWESALTKLEGETSVKAALSSILQKQQVVAAKIPIIAPATTTTDTALTATKK